MSHTVVGVFDTSNEAQTALQKLVSTGIARESIDIKPRTATDDGDEDEGFGESISNFFSNLFGNDERTERYSNYARTTGAIVTVHARTAQEAEHAATILDEHGAVDLDERTSGATTGYGAAAGASTGTPRTETTSSDDTTIPVIEEELHVGKRTVETGGVRVRSRIVEKPVEEHLRLREEHVHIQRNPVDRAATDADFSRFKEGEVELTERAEVPVVSKENHVVEEVRISKDVEEHDEAIRDTVRKTDVEIDKLNDDDVRRNRTEGNGPRQY